MGCGPERPQSVEDHRLVPVAEDALVEMPAHGARKCNALQIAPPGDEILNLVAVRDARHVLLDDGAVVQRIRYVVTRRADQLHPARMHRVIGPRPGEGWQKRMMDVDNPGRIAGHESGR